MWFIYSIFILISQSFSARYLPNESIINIRRSSGSEYLVLNKTDFPPNTNIFIYFRVIEGYMYSSHIDCGTTNIYPKRNADIPELNETISCFNDGNYAINNYIFEIKPFSENYYIIERSGFTGQSLSMACTIYNEKAMYLPRGGNIILSPSNRGYIYLNYEEFKDYNDFYMYFKVKTGNMSSIIQYKETDADPGFITSFSSAKEKKGIYRKSSLGEDNVYVFDFLEKNNKYLIIYYSSLNGSEITLSSSIKIKNLSNDGIIKESFNYGFIYLKFSEFPTYDIYLYFEVSDGLMNNYLEYAYLNREPIYEEELPSLNKKFFDKDNEPNYYGLEFLQNENYQYLLIKYSGFSGNSISIKSSPKIYYLPKDHTIVLSNNKVSNIYLKYSDFSDSDDDDYLYLYFELSSGNKQFNIYYLPSEKNPISEGHYDFGDWMMEFGGDDFKSYLYRFEKRKQMIMGNQYLMIRYSGFIGETLTILSLSVNPKASLLYKDQYNGLSSSAKSGFVFVDCRNFSNEDEFYVYFESFKGNMHANISYIYTDKAPSKGQYYSSLIPKNSDKYDEDSDSSLYSYIFNNPTNRYLLIKYSGYSGKSLYASAQLKILLQCL